MKLFQKLQRELHEPIQGTFAPHYFRYLGYHKNMAARPPEFRANAVYSLFTEPKPVILKNEIIAGNRRCQWIDADPQFLKHTAQRAGYFRSRTFVSNNDHFAPNYRHTLAVGIPGLIAEIDASMENHKDEAEKVEMLQAMRLTLCGFRQMIANYITEAENCKQNPEYDAGRLDFIIENCTALVNGKPETFAQALQLICFCHIAFLMEGRGAMAFGRMDQYLYPFYKADIEAGRITDEQVIEMLENVFIRIEGHIDNICIGGQNVKGECEINELSRCILRAVNGCHVPGPNLSLRYTENIPDDFLDECLQVIGTGLGYPAMMNDDVHITALKRYGYKDEDLYDYCMVGCIENFISGKQPPWTDDRFNPPAYFEYIFNHGESETGKAEENPWFSYAYGLDTGSIDDIHSMEDFMAAYEKQLAFGVDEYCARIEWENNSINQAYYPEPFLCCFCDDCIERGLDINNGGARYPSVHGAVLMGVATTADSLAAIEKVIFIDKEATLAQLWEAIRANYEGYEWLQEKLLAAPKYGNNDDFVDKYAVWFVDYLDSCFAKHRTRDGGYYYLATASNVANIGYGQRTNATPDGRKRGEPLSDAASPAYGKDTRGPTAAFSSLCKPDYTKVACGTVVNQKYSPSMFNDEKRQKLMALIRTYFKKGGAEIQINSTSREVLMDAMEHPENYQNLVVRVSGFSSFYVTLDKDVQLDILHRTQQG